MRDRSVLALLGGAVLVAVVATVIYRGPAGREPAPDRLVAIFKTASTSNEFWASVREGVESGAADFGFSVSIRAPREEIYVEEQVAIVREVIESKPAAIILAAADVDKLVEPVREARRRGIHVVLVDSFISTNDAEARIGTDNEEAGRRCGEALLRAVKPGAEVAVMSYVKGSSTAIGREGGLLEVLSGRVRLTGTSYSNSSADLAYSQARELLASGAPPDAIAALNLPTAVGAARALAESGKKGQLVLVGVDSSAEIIKFIEQGVIRSTIVQKPFNMGYLAIKAARGLMEGKRSPGFVNTGSVDVDRANMFEPANQKLLFPVSRGN